MIILKLLSILLIPIFLFGVFLMGLLMGNNVDLNSINFNSDSLTSWITALATLAIASLTFVLALETWRLRLSQIKQINDLRKESIKPQIDFYLLSSQAAMNLMDIHIENMGKGIAKNIQFKFFGDEHKELTESEENIVNKLLKLNILKKGIASLGSGKKRSSYVFSFYEVSEKFKKEIFNANILVEINYQDIESNNFTTILNLDFSEFIGISEIGGGNPLYEIKKESKKIREILEGFSSSNTSKHLNIKLQS